jgi:hypothetical protein
MLCPYCLADVKFRLEGSYFCPDCNEKVPAMYVRGYGKYPPRIVSAVGLRGHGKTVYFASLFYVLKESRLPAFWQPDFFALSLTDEDLETVHSNAKMLKDGKLPGSTPMNFPRPTMLRVAGIPMWQNQRDCTLVFYDTSGEAFERASELVKYARFARQAQMVMLLVSLLDLQDPPHQMQTLLNTYVIGIEDLGGSTRNQDLMVVYTKADAIADRLAIPPWDGVRAYLADGSVNSLAQVRGYQRRMYEMSNKLYDFTRKELQSHQFVNLAETSFRSVGFSIVSALGAAPEDGHLSAEVDPLRVLDPIIWMMEMAPPAPQRRPWWMEPSQWTARLRGTRHVWTEHLRWVGLAALAGAIYGAVGGILGSLIGGSEGSELWALVLGGVLGLVGGFSGGQMASNWRVLLKPSRWILAQGVVLPGSAAVGTVAGGAVGLLAWLLIWG